MNYWASILKKLENFDITEIFKTKGKLKRWSAKRSIGGVIVTTALADIAKGEINYLNLALILIGVLPLMLSFFERD